MEHRAKEKGLDAVVWEDLPPKFRHVAWMDFNEDVVIRYLMEVVGNTLDKART